MEIKHKIISDASVSKFNAEEFISDYPYIIKNKETGETIIGTLCKGNYEYFSLTFNIFNEVGEMSEFSINVNEANKYEFMKPIMKDSLEETENVPDEISDEEKDESTSDNKSDESKSDRNINNGIDPDKMSRLVDNLSKFGCGLINCVDKDDPDGSNINSLAKRFGTVLTRTIDYNENKTRLSEDSDIANINNINNIFSIESNDYIGIKKFYYKRTHVKNETEDTDTISILIPHEYMKITEEMYNSLGYKIHPMFIDINNVIHDKILIGRNILKHDDIPNLSDQIEPCNSITMEMYSGLQMLYFIERGLNKTSPEFHGITDLYGDTWVLISCLRIICKNANLSIELGNGTTIDISDPFDGYIRRFKQIEGCNDYLFIPKGCTWTKGELCDSYNEVSLSYITSECERMLVGGSNDFADGALWNYDYHGHVNSLSGANIGVRQYRYLN